MTTTTPNAAPDAGNQPEANNGFFINNGSLSGWFTTPDGDIFRCGRTPRANALG